MKKTQSQIQKGMGLLELMFTLAIIAILLLGAIKYYQGVRVSMASDEAVKKIANVVAACERWGAAHRGSFSDITGINQLVDRNLLPESFSMNEWGGSVDVKAISSHKIKIFLTNIPSNICFNLGQKLAVKEDVLEKMCSMPPGAPPVTFFYCYPDQNGCVN